MKKTTNLLLSLISATLMVTGCGNKNSSTVESSSSTATSESSTVTQTAAEKVQEAANLLVYSGLTEITKDFALIQTVAGLEDVTITYTVAPEATNYLKVEGTTMKVTRPANGEGDKRFTPGFTATLTCGEATQTKSFNALAIGAKQFVVQEAAEITVSSAFNVSWFTL